MTAVLGYVTQAISVILCDRRINFGKYQEFGYSDENKKLVDLTEMGWASGAGLATFLDEFKDNLDKEYIKDTDDIIRAFNVAVGQAKEQTPHLSKEIDKSSAMISWFGVPSEQQMTFRVGILSNHHFGSNIALINDEEIQTLYPGDYIDNPDLVKDFEERFEKSIGFQGDIEDILDRMLHMFDEISSNSKYVSKCCDIGLHCFTQNGILKLKISGEVNELISEIENGNINNRLELINQ